MTATAAVPENVSHNEAEAAPSAAEAAEAAEATKAVPGEVPKENEGEVAESATVESEKAEVVEVVDDDEVVRAVIVCWCKIGQLVAFVWRQNGSLKTGLWLSCRAL